MQDLSKIRGKLIGSDDERAVSPVIGVILMVAITVILAAVIAAFVLDMGDDIGDDGAPDVVWDSSQTDRDEVNDTQDDDYEVVTFTHDGGDNIEVDNFDFTTDGTDGDFNLDTSAATDGVMTSGDEIAVQITDTDSWDGLDEGDEVELLWVEEGSSSTLTSHTMTSSVDDDT